jgi:hypothetical protein
MHPAWLSVESLRFDLIVDKAIRDYPEGWNGHVGGQRYNFEVAATFDKNVGHAAGLNGQWRGFDQPVS